MSQKFILTFNDKTAYEKGKLDVVAGGGTISNDYGEALLGFAAVIPTELAQSLQSNLVDNGIHSFEADSVVTTQQQ